MTRPETVIERLRLLIDNLHDQGGGQHTDDLEALLAAVEAAKVVKDGFPFLDGVAGEDYGGHWVSFVESLAAVYGSSE